METNENVREEFEKAYNLMPENFERVSSTYIVDWFLSKFHQEMLSLAKEVDVVLKRHTDWKPARCESEEELGYQKGLIAEAKLLEKELSHLIHSRIDKLK